MTEQQIGRLGELGYEYRAAMKGWRHELAVRWRIRRGLIRDYAARRQDASMTGIDQ